jgi:hypothetical protein
MEYKYGEFTNEQFNNALLKLRKKIFFLLLYVDPKTKDEYTCIDINGAFENLLYELAGMNSLFSNPPELVTVCNLLEAARMEYFADDFNFKVYRKLILDSGVEIMKIGGA